MKYPSISIVIATFNAQKTIEKCLKSIQNQNYPEDKIDIVIADGSSKDKTVEIAKKFTKKIIIIEPDKQNAEYNKAIGVLNAFGEMLLMLDHDNILPHRNWLLKMVEPLMKHKEVVGVETLRYHYDPHYSLLDRYFGLFGAGDPLAFYLGKADRLAFIYDTYNLFGRAKDYEGYYLVKFDKNHIPTLGANGFMIRRDLLIKHAKTAPNEFFHIDVNVDLIRKGFDTYAFIKDSIIHLTNYGNVFNFLKRRKLFMEQYHFKAHSKRRYSVYEQKDFFALLKFILYSATFIKPTIDATRGFIKIHDFAWFLHPFLSFTLLTIYSYVFVKVQIKKYARQIF